MSFDVESAASPSAASREILDRLEGISGARHVIADAPGMEGFLREPRDRFHGKALCVVHRARREKSRKCSNFVMKPLPRLCRKAAIPGSWAVKFLSAPAIKSCFRLAA